MNAEGFYVNSCHIGPFHGGLFQPLPELLRLPIVYLTRMCLFSYRCTDPCTITLVKFLSYPSSCLDSSPLGNDRCFETSSILHQQRNRQSLVRAKSRAKPKISQDKVLQILNSCEIIKKKAKDKFDHYRQTRGIDSYLPRDCNTPRWVLSSRIHASGGEKEMSSNDIGEETCMQQHSGDL
ncbi:hypothetical protein FF38_06574 [Lucilia cuprina]|uniref:Uncharacterized protein n=1 Tax=Lucilia cuprina TaxID=7375 RepID=A0A0L0CAY3_LUCCU|nr:hypothetical protein FF38_06574 [Lucilia cuprina]